MTNETKCSTPRCRGDIYLICMGKPLCERCWDKHCKNEAPKVEMEKRTKQMRLE